MKKKVLSLAACAVITIAGLSGVKAAANYDKHYAVIAMKECKSNNNDCSKFTGAGVAEVAQPACKANGCEEGCIALMENFGGDKAECK